MSSPTHALMKYWKDQAQTRLEDMERLQMDLDAERIITNHYRKMHINMALQIQDLKALTDKL